VSVLSVYKLVVGGRKAGFLKKGRSNLNQINAHVRGPKVSKAHVMHMKTNVKLTQDVIDLKAELVFCQHLYPPRPPSPANNGAELRSCYSRKQQLTRVTG
jgi:hypothetical protein